jgi:methylase of polypeptide subunit release factors
VLLNRLEEKVTIQQGDLFASVQGQRFDRILFNPPFHRGTPTDGFSTAWRSNDVVERFAAGLAEHLTAVGFALVLLSTAGDLAGFLQTFAANQLQTTIVTQRDMGNEVFTLYRLDV